MRTGCNQSCRLRARHLQCKTGAAQCARLYVWRYLLTHLMRHGARPNTLRGCLETFAEPSHWHLNVLQFHQHAAQGRHGRANDDQILRGSPWGQFRIRRTGALQCIREINIRQIALVTALRLHGFGCSSITRPQLNSMTCCVPTGTDGQCCAPSTCPNDRNLQAH